MNEKGIQKTTDKIKQAAMDFICVIIAGIIVGFAYYFFQNSNGFAPSGVGGLATSQEQ